LGALHAENRPRSETCPVHISRSSSTKVTTLAASALLKFSSECRSWRGEKMANAGPDTHLAHAIDVRGDTSLRVDRLACLLQPTDRSHQGVLRLVIVDHGVCVVSARPRQILLGLDRFEHVTYREFFSFFSQSQGFGRCVKGARRLI